MMGRVHFHFFSQIKLFPYYEQLNSLNRIKHPSILSVTYFNNPLGKNLLGEVLSNASHILHNSSSTSTSR